MISKKSPTFPFEFIVMWVRPQNSGHPTCIFCKAPATHTMQQVMNPFGIAGKGFVDMDAEWSQAIQKQMNGDYTFALYQPACLECVQRFASIQLGKEKPIKQLLLQAEIAKRQQNIDLSLVICCTVRSLADEGDLWAMNTYHTTTEEIVVRIDTMKREAH